MFQALLLSALLAASPAAASTGAAPSRPIPTPRFRHYGVSDGLPSSNIYTLTEDARGVIWIGTANGLVRFDGTHFRTFRHDPRNPHSLAANGVAAVLVDHRQRLWVGGEGTGLNLYRPVTGDFKSWRHQAGNPHRLAGDDIGALAEGPDGSIWVGLLGKGLDRLLPDGRIRHLRHDPHDSDSLASDIVICLRQGRDGSLWIGGFAGLDRRMPGGRIRHVRFEHASGTIRVWSIDGKPGHLRLGTNQGLYRLDADGVARPMAADVLKGNKALTSLRTPDGSLWVGTQDGLYWIGAHGRHRYFPPHVQTPNGLPGRLIWSLMLDHEGGLWIGTRAGGVAYLRPTWRQFTVFKHRAGDADSLQMTRSIAQARFQGQLWVGGPGAGLDRLDPVTGKIGHVALDIGRDSVTALAAATDDQLWIGHSSGLILDRDGRMQEVGSGLPAAGVNRIVADKQGNAYASVPTGGVVRIDRNTLAVRDVHTRHGTSADRDTTKLQFHGGQLWRSSKGGLAQLDPASGQFVAVPGAPRGRIVNFAFDARGLWLVRPDSMQHYRVQHGRAVRDRVVGVDQGWPEISVVDMFCDRQQRVWLTTHTGLWRYDPGTGRFRAYGVEDGLPSPEFSSHSITPMPDGTVYTGTFDGVVGWNPARTHDHPKPPRLMLAAVTVQRDGHTRALPADGRPLHLRWNDHGLHVAAQALSYLDPKRNHYRFRLEGLDSGWVDAGTHGERDFTGLAHGHYRLRIEAAGAGNIWTALPPLSIQVAPPPWDTPWAWLVYVLAGLVLIWMILALARRRMEQRHRVQLAESERAMAQQASAAKSSFLATLGHEIRTPMTGVLGMAELLLRSPLAPRQRGYAETIQRSGTLLLRLVNEALDMARIEAGRLELELSDLDPRALLQDVVQLESGVAQDKGLQLTLEVAADVPARLLGDALRIKQVLLNLVNNALKFTEQGGIRLGLDCVDDGFEFTVADTGPGIPEASRERLFHRYEQADGPQRSSGTGLGLAICRELVALMDGRFRLKQSSARGSTFSVWLPLPVVDPATAPEPAPVPEAASGGERHGAHAVLLVEDDATVAEVIRGLLETSGHTVRHAPNGLAGLVETERERFDVVLLDLDLPGVDGFSIARMLREREQNDEHLPIIAITARSGGDEEERARAAGMDGFLRKPLSGEQLEAALHDLPG